MYIYIYIYYISAQVHARLAYTYYVVAEAMVSTCKDTEDKLKDGDKPLLHGCEVEG